MKHDLELFDVLVQRKGPQVIVVAKAMVEQLILRFRRLDDIDQYLDEVSIDHNDRPAANAMRGMLQEWAGHAEAVLARVSKFPFKADFKSLVESLEHSLGRTQARLTCSLDDIAEGARQAERGELIPIEEVRNELRARAHS